MDKKNDDPKLNLEHIKLNMTNLSGRSNHSYIENEKDDFNDLLAQRKRKRRRKKRRKRNRKKGAGEVTFVHYLPLGAGQFVNGDTGLGAGILSAQALSLGAAYYYWNESSTVADTLDSYIKEMQIAYDNETDQTRKEALGKEISANEQAYLEEENTLLLYANISNGVFVLAWIYGVYESIQSVGKAQISLEQRNFENSPLQPQYAWELKPFLERGSLFEVNKGLALNFEVLF